MDSLDGLEIIQDALSGLSDARIHLLLGIGFIGGCGGIRDNDDAQAIAEKVAQDSRLILRGVSGFEGIVTGAGRSSDGMAKVREFCQKIVAATKLVAPYVGTEKIIITAEGSAFLILSPRNSISTTVVRISFCAVVVISLTMVDSMSESIHLPISRA